MTRTPAAVGGALGITLRGRGFSRDIRWVPHPLALVTLRDARRIEGLALRAERSLEGAYEGSFLRVRIFALSPETQCLAPHKDSFGLPYFRPNSYFLLFRRMFGLRSLHKHSRCPYWENETGLIFALPNS